MGTLAGVHPAIIVRSCRVCGGAGAPARLAAVCCALPAWMRRQLLRRCWMRAGQAARKLMRSVCMCSSLRRWQPRTNALRAGAGAGGCAAVRWIRDTRGRKYPPRGYLACYGVSGSRGRWAACVYGLGLVCWHTSCAGRASKHGNLAQRGALPARGHAVLWKAVTLATSRNLKAARSIQL